MRATGAGSLPGDDFRGSLDFVLAEFPEMVPLPELPQRGITSQMVSRAVALLADMPAELIADSWQLTSHISSGQRSSAAQLRSDLDDLEEIAQEFEGTIKVAICGPWTLAALLGRSRGDVALADSGARRDICQSLTVGINTLFDDLSKRLPKVNFRLQIDEPMLPMVLAGEIPTASGYRRIPKVDANEVVVGLSDMAAGAILHCCAPANLWAIAKQAGFTGLHLDIFECDSETFDGLANWLETGHEVVLGILDSAALNQLPSTASLARDSLAIINKLEMDPQLITDQVLLSPVCGLANWQISSARKAMRIVSQCVEYVDAELVG